MVPIDRRAHFRLAEWAQSRTILNYLSLGRPSILGFKTLTSVPVRNWLWKRSKLRACLIVEEKIAYTSPTILLAKVKNAANFQFPCIEFLFYWFLPFFIIDNFLSDDDEVYENLSLVEKGGCVSFVNTLVSC